MREQQAYPMAQRSIGPDELAAQVELAAVRPAQGSAATAAPMLGVILSNVSYNRYAVQLAEPAAEGESPDPITEAYVSAVNAAEPFDEAGELEAGLIVLIWPSQGDYGFFCPRPTAEPTESSSSYWARVVSGGGPAYTIHRQVVVSDGPFEDDQNAANVSATNVWELTVDSAATADVPVGAVVRIFEELDDEEQTQRFFFYPIHTVYR